jgi:hypothetical protein
MRKCGDARRHTIDDKVACMKMLDAIYSESKMAGDIAYIK